MIFVVVITAIILIFTLFSLKSVSLNLKTETNYLTEEVQQGIINQVKKEKIKTVLFADKSKLTKKLEKEFPYIKIINIEIIIPSSYVIHCIEREELYVIESNDKVFYLDEELKVLKIIEEEFIMTESSPILLNISDLEFNFENLEEGQFLNFNKKGKEVEDILSNYTQKTLTTLLNSFEQNNRNIAILRSSYKEVKIEFKYLDTSLSVCLTLTDKYGFQTLIIDSNQDLPEKISVMIAAINELSTTNPEDLLNKNLIVFKNIDGELAYYLEDK